MKEAKVDLENKIVHISYDEAATNLKDLEKNISESGYQANELIADPDGYADLDKCCKVKADGGGH